MKRRNVDTPNLERTERVGFIEIGCGSTVEARWEHATRSMDGQGPVIDSSHWSTGELSGCKQRLAARVGERSG
jgi:hypothetical protein